MNAITVIQFLCPDPLLAEKIKERVLAQANIWSRLQYRSEDPEYGTSPFGMDEWHQHTQRAGLWWANYGAIYEHIGDHGRNIADHMFGDGQGDGILRHAPLALAYPNMRFEIVDVQDPVAQGYLPAPEVNEP